LQFKALKPYSLLAKNLKNQGRAAFRVPWIERTPFFRAKGRTHFPGPRSAKFSFSGGEDENLCRSTQNGERKTVLFRENFLGYKAGFAGGGLLLLHTLRKAMAAIGGPRISVPAPFRVGVEEICGRSGGRGTAVRAF